jgi:hypothetical protein
LDVAGRETGLSVRLDVTQVLHGCRQLVS